MRSCLTTVNWAGTVVPVMDLRDGCVVQARRGLSRREYPPLRSRLCHSSRPGEAAKHLIAAAQSSHLYAADLDGLLGGSPDWHTLRCIASCGAELWIDVGLRNADDARRMKVELAGRNYRAIVASESLTNPLDLPRIVRQWPGGQGIASIDMCRGEVKTGVPEWQGRDVLELARMFVEIGVDTIILLDLAAIGSDAGCHTAHDCRALHRRFPQLRLISGGGVRTLSDIAELRAAGCAHVLVASALHDGRVQLPFR